MFERFADTTRQAINIAGTEAEAMMAEIGTAHLLLGILQVESARGSELYEHLTAHGVGLDLLREAARKRVDVTDEIVTRAGVTFTSNAQKAIGKAGLRAGEWNDERVEPHHLLIALLDLTASTARDSLHDCNTDFAGLHRTLVSAYAPQNADAARPSAQPAKGKPAAGAAARRKYSLDQFARNLNQAARDGQLSPVLDRDDEILEIAEILTRWGKNTPVLVGEPGVGKTAVVEGFAQAIVARTAPRAVWDREVWAVDLGAMIAGARYRGDFEDRLQAVVADAAENPGYVLFFDEVHALLGAGSAEGSLDAATILKPALARGEVQAIGATTESDYAKHLERDEAFARRLQRVDVAEPALERACAMLSGLAERIADHHRLIIDPSAVEAAVALTHRYLPARRLPDKAIDALASAAARAALRRSVEPAELSVVEAQIDALRDGNAVPGGLRSSLERDNELARLCRRRDGLLASCVDADGSQLRLTDDDVAQVVHLWTKIPLAQISGSELDRYQAMEQDLDRRVVGQRAATSAVSRALRRRRAGLSRGRRPTGSFLFVGPTGVGKSELARALAGWMFGDDDAVLRLDMSEYMEQHSVARLVGAPPGYTGHQEGGVLIDRVRARPYQVLLIDEIEKAHPDVLNVFLQILEDGSLTDGRGRRAQFTETLIIFTSNAGAEAGARRIGFAAGDPDAARQERTLAELGRYFRPEFLNRMDEVVCFSPLGVDHLREIVDLLLGDVRAALAERGLLLELDESAIAQLIDAGFDDKLGARPLRRAVQRLVEDPVADLLLDGTLPDTGSVTATVDGHGALAFTTRRARRVRRTAARR